MCIADVTKLVIYSMVETEHANFSDRLDFGNLEKSCNKYPAIPAQAYIFELVCFGLHFLQNLMQLSIIDACVMRSVYSDLLLLWMLVSHCL